MRATHGNFSLLASIACFRPTGDPDHFLVVLVFTGEVELADGVVLGTRHGDEI